MAAGGCTDLGTLAIKPLPMTSAGFEAPAVRNLRRPCDVNSQIKQITGYHKLALGPKEQISGILTTPLKYASSLIDGPSAWRDTGCNASGKGVPLYTAQLSSDGIYTVDVAIRHVEVEGQPVPDGEGAKYVRLEILPGRPSHASIGKRRPGCSDLIRFSGPLVWDKDPPHGHMEIHPIDAIEFIDKVPPSPQCEHR
jgi:hypothetical protein